MQITTLLGLAILSALGAAENNIGRDDVPRACLEICQPTIILSGRCDRQTDEDATYRRCVCGAQDAQLQMNQCAACVRENGMSDPDDNDVADLMDDCGWDFNTATGGATAVTSTRPPATVMPTPTGVVPIPTEVVSTRTGVVPTQTDESATATITQTPTAASDSSSTEQSPEISTDNAAPAATAGLTGLLFAAGAAAALF